MFCDHRAYSEASACIWVQWTIQCEEHTRTHDDTAVLLRDHKTCTTAAVDCRRFASTFRSFCHRPHPPLTARMKHQHARALNLSSFLFPVVAEGISPVQRHEYTAALNIQQAPSVYLVQDCTTFFVWTRLKMVRFYQNGSFLSKCGSFCLVRKNFCGDDCSHSRFFSFYITTLRNHVCIYSCYVPGGDECEENTRIPSYNTEESTSLT